MTGQPHLFRTYGPEAREEGCRIADACRATSAATMFFPSITINGIEYVDGAFGNNNPSELALDELESDGWLSPLADAVNGVGCFVSIGTGVKAAGEDRDAFSRRLSPKLDKVRLQAQLATDCERKHRDLQKRCVTQILPGFNLFGTLIHIRFTKAGRSDAYHRFNVDTGLESVKLDHGDEVSLGCISDMTLSYLKRNRDCISRCALLLKPTNGTWAPFRRILPPVVSSVRVANTKTQC